VGVARDVFVLGGTGYIGTRLIAALLFRGHRVRALTREASASRVPPGATPVPGDALSAESVTTSLRPGDTLVHLIGTPHPSPSKAAEFQRVDLASARAAATAARDGRAAHVVYVSVAQPAPIMKAYVEARAEAERAFLAAGVPATFLRPWYVLGPGHWWPVLLLPFYLAGSLLPASREGARRLGLVTIRQMLDALVWSVENPSEDAARVLDVPAIRKGRTP
jgi:uncharacterized protein YbjT (DUF2867 family)